MMLDKYHIIYSSRQEIPTPTAASGLRTGACGARIRGHGACGSTTTTSAFDASPKWPVKAGGQSHGDVMG